MKVLVTGVSGQLGYDVIKELLKRGITAIGSSTALSNEKFTKEFPGSKYVSMDITNAARVRDVLYSIKPDAVINCAAWTAVDAAEDENNREMVLTVNATAPRTIAEICRELDCKMLHISTDYVFDGKGDTPFKTGDAADSPLNYYGETKRLGEKAVSSTLSKFFIVRISWVFGINGKNFVKTMLNVGKTHDEIRVVCDQFGTPTYTVDLARLLADMIQTDKYGYYHASNEGGYISWYDFTCEIFKQAGYTTKITPVTTAEYGVSRALRPTNSRLDKSDLTKNGFALLPDWKDAVSRYIKELSDNNK